MSNEPSNSDPAPDDPDRERRTLDFQRFYKERDDWKKAMFDAEASYDTLLASISTLALGASLAKDWATTTTGLGNFFLTVSWVAFACCLGLCLIHRYWTYYTHRTFIEKCDAEFLNWSPDVWERCDKAYDSTPMVKHVEKLKKWAGIAVSIGIGSSFCLLVVERFAAPKDHSTPVALPFNQTINVFPSTQPTTQKVSP